MRYKPGNASPGSVRPSQVVYMFGPGSIVQLEHDSVMITGIDTWDQESYQEIHHPVLEATLCKDHFRMYKPDGKRPIISCTSFPRWSVCTSCGRMQYHSDTPGPDKKFSCDWCHGRLSPAQLVVGCKKGHLDEFPWWEWVHRHSRNSCDANQRDISFGSYGENVGMSDHFVECLKCHAKENCGAALGKYVNKIAKCSGKRPWLDDHESCNEDIQGIQLLSYSLYYPLVQTALQVKEWSHPIQQKINAYKREIDGARKFDTPFNNIAQSDYFYDMREQFSIKQIVEELKKRYQLNNDFGKHSTEYDIRHKEYTHLISSEGDRDEHTHITSVQPTEKLHSYIEKLVLVNRITEVRVIRAFSRLAAPDPYSSEDDVVHFCPISKENTNWYPAVENKGEGVLFSLDAGRLAEWERRPDVIDRCNVMLKSYQRWSKERCWSDHKTSPRYLLLHTLSHMIIRDMASRSGYDETSIRERLYYGERYNGILVYTASPSADGSLGGLVRLGEPDTFEKVLYSAIQRSKHCTRDPLCLNDDPKERQEMGFGYRDAINGSACYGCALLPETSCEHLNLLLDRRLLVGDIGFFGGEPWS